MMSSGLLKDPIFKKLSEVLIKQFFDTRVNRSCIHVNETPKNELEF